VSRLSVDILLATYNGERFLAEQLESIVRQSYKEWRVIVRDDGSADRTMEIIQRFRSEMGGRLVVVRDGLGRLGPALNFGRLLGVSDAPYVALCDQDDVWHPEKLERLLAIMWEAEREVGAEAPVLVHSDLTVIDAEGRVIARSFWKYQGLRPEVGNSWRRLLVQNVVTGCASMFNGALRVLAAPVPPEAVMHDWWLALVAACLGRVKHTWWCSTFYRQHGANDTGAKRWSVGYVMRRVGGLAGDRSLEKTQAQATALVARYGERLGSDVAEVVSGYGGLKEKGAVERRLYVARHGLWKIGVIRNLGMLVRM
jgi:glycosyltransferase involved in cell wall biosynthesis